MLHDNLCSKIQCLMVKFDIILVGRVAKHIPSLIYLQHLLPVSSRDRGRGMHWHLGSSSGDTFPFNRFNFRMFSRAFFSNSPQRSSRESLVMRDGDDEEETFPTWPPLIRVIAEHRTFDLVNLKSPWISVLFKKVEYVAQFLFRRILFCFATFDESS